MIEYHPEPGKGLIFNMKITVILLLLLAAIFSMGIRAYSADDARISIVLDSFSPPKLQQGVPFEMIFKLKNSGTKAVTPSAEVTLYGDVYDSDRNPALRIVDKTYRVYNFYPGAVTGKQRLYIGSLRKGSYTIRLDITTYNRTKNAVVSQVKLDIPINVD